MVFAGKLNDMMIHVLVKRQKTCDFECACPSGYTSGFSSYRRHGLPCHTIPTIKCFRLDASDYVTLGLLVALALIEPTPAGEAALLGYLVRRGLMTVPL